jgi:hypothetical protein
MHEPHMLHPDGGSKGGLAPDVTRPASPHYEHLNHMADLTGLEPVTFALTVRRSTIEL